MVTSSSDSEIQLKEMLHALWQNKWLIILVTGLCAFLGFSYANYTKPLYRASAIIMPPLTSSVVPLNETTLNLFTSENLFAIFASVLKSEDTKYDFFKKNILPTQEVASEATPSSYKLYKKFSKAFKIDSIPGTDNYKISVTNTNPLLIPKEIKNYIDFVNQQAFSEVLKISKNEHERSALLIQHEIVLMKEIAVNKIKSQLVVLDEALNIAETVGIQKPLKNKKLIDSFDPDPNHLYNNGSKPLKALIHNLSQRTNHDAFIPDLDSMIKRHDFYQNYQLTSQNHILYQLDGIKVPASLISFSKVVMTVTSLLLGLLLSIIMVMTHDRFFKNRELHA